MAVVCLCVWQVNGTDVLSESAFTLLDLVVSCTCLDLVVARPRTATLR